MDGDAPLGQLGGHQVGGAHFFKTEFRVGMNISANGGNRGGLGHNGINDFHNISFFYESSAKLPGLPQAGP